MFLEATIKHMKNRKYQKWSWTLLEYYLYSMQQKWIEKEIELITYEGIFISDISIVLQTV